MFRWNLSTKVVMAYSGLIALMAGALTTTLYWQFRTAHQQAMHDRLLDLLSLTVPLIDSDYHSLTLTPKDIDKPYYTINQKKSKRFKLLLKGLNVSILYVRKVRVNSTLCYITIPTLNNQYQWEKVSKN